MKKRSLKNFLAGLMTLVMVLALIPSQAYVHEAEAATSSTSALHYNTGHRDTVAVDLSDAADAYYSDFAYDYSKIADGSVSVTASELCTALASYMQSTLENMVTYSSLPTYWAYSDAQDGTAGVTFFYTDEVSTSTGDLNREHVWPKSAASFYELNGGADLHHLRPAHSTVNSARSNYVMAEFDETASGTKTVTYNGKVAGYLQNNQFEPIENVKGDVARIFLYVYLCWGQPNLFEDVPTSALPTLDTDSNKNKNDGTKRIESLETLLQWCYDDPVDTWEMEQNDIIELVQGNRNVFIDYPEYAWLIFGLEVPEGIASPASGNATHGTYDPGDLSGISGGAGEVVIDETQAISLAEANKAAAGTMVTVVGQVTARFGLNDSLTSAIITDENGDALQLYFNNAAFKYAIGDVIAVNGSISTYHGVNQINSGFASKLLTSAADAAAVAPATEVTVAELVANPDAYLNKNVVVKNVVLGMPDSANNTTAISQTIDGVTTTMNLYYPASYPSGVEMTDTVDIYAVASKRDTEAQLRVGQSSDYVLVSKGEGYTADLTTEAGILEAAFLLKSGESLGQKVTLTGEITSIKTAYSSQYNNVSVNIKVADKTILCYRLAGGSELAVGDKIAVTGTITNYNGTVEYVAGSTYVKVGAEVTPTVAPTATAEPTTTAAPTTTAEPTATAEPTVTVAPAIGGAYLQITTVDEIKSGDKIVLYGVNSTNGTTSTEYAMSSSISKNRLKGVAATIENGIVVAPTEDIIWTVTINEDGTYYLYNEALGKYLSLKNNSSSPYILEAEPSEYSAFTLTATEGSFVFKGVAVARIISIYSADFRAYTEGGKELQTLNVYKYTEPSYNQITTKDEIVSGSKFVFYGLNSSNNSTGANAVNAPTEYAMGSTLSYNKLKGVSVTIEDGVVLNPSEDVIWTIYVNEDGTYYIYNESLGKYLSLKNNSTSPYILEDEPSEYSAFTLTVSDGNFAFKGVAVARIISIYATDFRAYKEGGKELQTMNLYMLGFKKSATPTPAPTDTPVPTATSTPVPTATSTPVPTATSTPVPTATNTPVPTATSTPVPTATSTPVPTATNTPVPTVEPTEAPSIEGKYQLISSLDELGEGGLVVFYGISSQAADTAYAMGNKLDTSRPVGVEVEIIDGVITNPDASIVWMVTKLEDGTYTLYNAAAGKYLNLEKDAPKAFTLGTTAIPYKLVSAENGDFRFQSTVNARYISIYKNDFRGYLSTAKELGTLNLYKLVEEVEEPTPAPVVLPVETVVTAAWGNTTQMDVTITNNTEAVIKNWKIELAVNGTVTAVYNANLLGAEENGCIIACPDWDKNLAAGESKTFTIVVEADETVVVGTATLLSKEVTNDASAYTVSENKNAWYGGYVTNVEIANISDAAIDSWTLEFDFADEITGIWNATIVSHEGNHYVLECASYNAVIAANGTVSFGFTGVPADGEYSEAVFENVVLKSVQ